MFSDSNSHVYQRSFIIRKHFPNVDAAKEHDDKSDLDIISVLSAAQGVKVDILPITWQAAQARFREGGTSRINQRQLDLGMTFAFKCVKAEEKETKSEKYILQQIINEITILGSTSTRQHPHVVNLEGICWDIGADQKVWPALVFEHSQYGDLQDFARQLLGRELPMDDRVKLCVDIATAISDMHARGIVHGDIKPLNILVFKTPVESFTAKVTDFGYSRTFTSADERYTLARSRPWSAPEHDRSQRRFNKDEACRTDLYSLGMVIIWFLFRDIFCREKNLPDMSAWARELFQGFTSPTNYTSTGTNESDYSEPELPFEYSLLEDLKYSGKLNLLSRQLISSSSSLTNEQKSFIGDLLERILQHSPKDRQAGIDDLLNKLQPCRYRQSADSEPEISMKPVYPDFQITNSVKPLYRGDYRLRRHIVTRLQRCLLNTSLGDIPGSTRDNNVRQLSLCIIVGFGSAKSECVPQMSYHHDRGIQMDIQRNLNEWKAIRPEDFTEPISREQVQKGSFSRLDSGDYYRSQGCLEDAIRTITEEAQSLVDCIGNDNIMSYTMETALASMFRAVPRLVEAEKWSRQAYDTSRLVYKDIHGDVLNTMGNLAAVLIDQRKFQEGEMLLKRQMSMESKLLKEGDMDLLISHANLASLYRKQERFDKCEEIERHLVQRRREVQGENNQDCLDSMANLASTLTDQSKYDEAEEYERHVWNARQTILGNNHPDTLAAGNNLFVTYLHQSKWSDAAELGGLILKERTRLLGEQNAFTANTMTSLSAAYKNLGQWEEAMSLASKATKIYKDTLGEFHEQTLSAIAIEGTTLFSHGESDKAKGSYEEVLCKMSSDNPRRQAIERNYETICGR
ncbi:kinase-like domain-containing protein [Annulohypoxylon nitens]|nr:kinase-like domain-containing protein [Annulohypoxylon nitens]